jgi:hypothetical protein
MSTATITPLPLKPDFRAIVKKASTPALRQKRARNERKAAARAVAIPVPTVPTVTV